MTSRVAAQLWRARWWATHGEETRRWAFYSIGAFMYPMDTGWMHGPHYAFLSNARGCGCPDDCNCRNRWRTNVCGCRAHQ